MIKKNICAIDSANARIVDKKIWIAQINTDVFFYFMIMNNIQISVPYGDCVLTVHHSKRTVSLLRTGKKGALGTFNHYPNCPEFERGWTKVTHTSIQRINCHIGGGNPSFNTCRELGFVPKKGENLTFDQACIGFAHDLAYEVARAHSQHVIEWELTNPATGETLKCHQEWRQEKPIFILSN